MECDYLSFDEIAKHLGISTSHVYRIHDELLIKLKLELLKEPYVKEWLIERKDEIEWNSDGSVYTD